MEEKKERTRRAYGKPGERNQKMVTFRCDIEVIGWLESQPNKGRYINNLIAADMHKNKPKRKSNGNDQ